MYDLFAMILAFLMTFFGGSPFVVAGNSAGMPSPKISGGAVEMPGAHIKNGAVVMPGVKVKLPENGNYSVADDKERPEEIV